MTIQIKSLLLFALASVVFAASAQAGSDVFLHIDGVRGESQDQNHRDEIDVLGWSWTMSSSTEAPTGGGGTAGSALVRDIKIRKYTDSATTDLVSMLLSGTPAGRAVLTVRRRTPSIEFFKVEMEEVVVTRIAQGGERGEDDQQTETIALAFAKFCIEYTETEIDNSPGPSERSCWDIGANKAY